MEIDLKQQLNTYLKQQMNTHLCCLIILDIILNIFYIQIILMRPKHIFTQTLPTNQSNLNDQNLNKQYLIQRKKKRCSSYNIYRIEELKQQNDLTQNKVNENNICKNSLIQNPRRNKFKNSHLQNLQIRHNNHQNCKQKQPNLNELVCLTKLRSQTVKFGKSDKSSKIQKSVCETFYNPENKLVNQRASSYKFSKRYNSKYQLQNIKNSDLSYIIMENIQQSGPIDYYKEFDIRNKIIQQNNQVGIIKKSLSFSFNVSKRKLTLNQQSTCKNCLNLQDLKIQNKKVQNEWQKLKSKSEAKMNQGKHIKNKNKNSKFYFNKGFSFTKASRDLKQKQGYLKIDMDQVRRSVFIRIPKF